MLQRVKKAIAAPERPVANNAALTTPRGPLKSAQSWEKRRKTVAKNVKMGRGHATARPQQETWGGGRSLASARSVETTASRSGNTCSEKAPTPRGAGESGDARRRWAPGKTRAQHVNRGTRCTRCALGKRASATHRTLRAFTSAARQQQEIPPPPPLRAHGLCDLPGASAWPNLRIALLFFFCFLPQRKTDGIIVLYGYVDVADVNADLICVRFNLFVFTALLYASVYFICSC